MNVSVRQEVTNNATSANLVNEQNRKAGTTCFPVRDGLRAISNNTSLPSDRTLDTEEDTIVVFGSSKNIVLLLLISKTRLRLCLILPLA